MEAVAAVVVEDCPVTNTVKLFLPSLTVPIETDK